MTKLPRISGKDLLRILQKHGFIINRIKGSHHIVKHPDGRRTVIPVHGKEIIGPGLLSKIIKECEISFEDLV